MEEGIWGRDGEIFPALLLEGVRKSEREWLQGSDRDGQTDFLRQGETRQSTEKDRETDSMDTLALEATQPKWVQNAPMLTGPPGPTPAKRKPTKKAKKAVVFFEVEILDAKTKDKLCFLDKVRVIFFIFYYLIQEH